MSRRGLVAVLLVAGLQAGAAPQDAWAHAGLTKADPAPGATLGAAPTAVRLSFTERPEPSLSSVDVSGPGGAAFGAGSPTAAPGDSLTLVAPLRPLGRGTYTVSFRTVSAVDGHATTGTYAFGVGVSPTAGALSSGTTQPKTSALEVVARWALLAGLVALIGAAVAGAAGFAGTTGSDLRLAAGGWMAAVAGLVLLTVAQRRAAGSSLGTLLDTPVGGALIWRAVAVVAAGAALYVARRAPGMHRPALSAAALAALAAVTVHVANGHAAAGTWPHALTIAAQVAHFAAAGVWIGGLAALLMGVRGAPSDARAAWVRRFSAFAAGALGLVLVTGVVRAVDELSAWDDLVDTGYGRAVLAKVVLIALIARLGWRNRRVSVPAAAEDLGPLRRTSRVELGLAAAALAVAALLGSLAPPVTGQPAGVRGLSDSGSDFATTVRVRLTAVSSEPGPNRFVARVEDYDSNAAVKGALVRLRFAPLDDPAVAATSLALRPAPDGAYAGTGANLAFDGRWRVTVLVQRGANAVEVPLDLYLPGPEQFVSTLRVPGRPPAYTMQIGRSAELGYLYLSPHPERAGPSRVYVTALDTIQSETPVERVVVTAARAGGPTRQRPVRRLGPARFVAVVNLEPGPLTIVVVARTRQGARLRGVFHLNVPGR